MILAGYISRNFFLKVRDNYTITTAIPMQRRGAIFACNITVAGGSHRIEKRVEPNITHEVSVEKNQQISHLLNRFFPFSAFFKLQPAPSPVPFPVWSLPPSLLPPHLSPSEGAEARAHRCPPKDDSAPAQVKDIDLFLSPRYDGKNISVSTITGYSNSETQDHLVINNNYVSFQGGNNGPQQHRAPIKG